MLLLLEKDHKDLLFKTNMIHHDIINSLQTSHEHKLVLASCITVTIHLSPPWSLGRELGLSMYKEAGGEPKKVSLTRKSKSIHADIQNKQFSRRVFDFVWSVV